MEETDVKISQDIKHNGIIRRIDCICLSQEDLIMSFISLPSLSGRIAADDNKAGEGRITVP